MPLSSAYSYATFDVELCGSDLLAT